MRQTNERYYFRNEPVEERTMMSVADLVKHCKMHGIPLDSILVFRENRKDDKTDRNVVDVLEVHKLAGDQPEGLTYLILGGHQ